MNLLKTFQFPKIYKGSCDFLSATFSDRSSSLLLETRMAKISDWGESCPWAYFKILIDYYGRNVIATLDWFFSSLAGNKYMHSSFRMRLNFCQIWQLHGVSCPWMSGKSMSPLFIFCKWSDFIKLHGNEKTCNLGWVIFTASKIVN